MSHVRVYFSISHVKVYFINEGRFQEVNYSDLLKISSPIKLVDIMKMYKSKIINIERLGENLVDYLLDQLSFTNPGSSYADKLKVIKNCGQVEMAISSTESQYKDIVSFMFKHLFRVEIQHGDNRNSIRTSNDISLHQAVQSLACPVEYSDISCNFLDFNSPANTMEQVQSSYQVFGATSIILNQSFLHITCESSSLKFPLNIKFPVSLLHSFFLPPDRSFEVSVDVDQQMCYKLHLDLDQASEIIEVSCSLRHGVVKVSGRVNNNEFIWANS